MTCTRRCTTGMPSISLLLRIQQFLPKIVDDTPSSQPSEPSPPKKTRRDGAINVNTYVYALIFKTNTPPRLERHDSLWVQYLTVKCKTSPVTFACLRNRQRHDTHKGARSHRCHSGTWCVQNPRCAYYAWRDESVLYLCKSKTKWLHLVFAYIVRANCGCGRIELNDCMHE